MPINGVLGGVRRLNPITQNVVYTTGAAKKIRTILMHREILNISGFSIKVDRINHDTLNNTRGNLRAGSNRDNMSNLNGKQSGKFTSKYVGVSWDKSKSKWKACIRIAKKKITLGRFVDELAAANAYLAATKQHCP